MQFKSNYDFPKMNFKYKYYFFKLDYIVGLIAEIEGTEIHTFLVKLT